MKSKVFFHFISSVIVLALAVPLWSIGGQGGNQPNAAKDNTAVGITDIQLSYKLDPRLSGPTYGGERWVSPPIFTGASAQDTVEVRAVGLDAANKSIRIRPKWIASDPEMVVISPGQGDQVKLTVKHTGESKLQVVSDGVSKELAVKAEYQGKALQVQITPGAAKVTAPATSEQAANKSGASEQPSVFKTAQERFSYALGMNLGKALRKESLEVDTALVHQGLQDAYSDSKALMNEDELRATLLENQKQLNSKHAAIQAEKTKELAAKNKKEGEAFLAENKTKDGVVTLKSGLQYKVLRTGEGKKPTLNDTVFCHYRGSLLGGQELDSSYRHDKPAMLPVKGVIKGWSEALQLMPVGSKWQLFVPSDLAYGEHGSTKKGIGPNATLTFEVELISIKDAAGDSARGPHSQDETKLGGGQAETSH